MNLLTPTPVLPREILFEIGKLLDGPSLVDCLQVAKDWHNTLQPLVWRTISHRHWNRGDFPLLYWIPLSRKNGPHTKAQKQREAEILWGLRHTCDLTFHNVVAIPRRNRFHQQPSLSVPASQFFLTVRRTPNLVRFALGMVSVNLSDHQLSTLFKLLNEMPKLEAVEIILPARSLPVLIETHFSFFAKLKELKLSGRWYTGVPTLGPIPDKITPWKLQELKTDRLDKSFLPYCPDLKGLTLDVNGINDPRHPVDLSLRKKFIEQLQELSKLDTINLNMYWRGQVDVQKFVKHNNNNEKVEAIRWVHTPQRVHTPVPHRPAKKIYAGPVLFALKDIFDLL
ncbi:hypothetical protein BG015_011412 [Linnemannia schmuckeri]|uniref:F-box domain-containing protein n=1 Tax=Linnemannia schmuckeri TaxID=64567 RepID=A0A9P5RW49_9FUNG|nr:hypothetical protein BG015_011412 [Linnemannia schmuckeri]